MPRFRRYRVFLICAVLLTIALVRLSRSRDWDGTSLVASQPLGSSKDTASSNEGDASVRSSSDPFSKSNLIVDIEKLAHSIDSTPGPSSVLEVDISPQGTTLSPTQTTTTPHTVTQIHIPDRVPLVATNGFREDDEIPKEIHMQAPGKVEPILFSPTPSPIHWVKQTEHFPVPAGSVIHLPTGRPVQMPTIQHVFSDETPDSKIIRERRLETIKDEFERAWNGYKTRAWMHDELRPVTGTFRDPFCGWAATLVDTLDTLWIMGFEADFEEAVRAVESIDFTTSHRADIPVFETTIRYLGGLLAAYDVSGAKYKGLLDKAVELAEILLGAFDTPNRMPNLYYQWRPTFASQPHRANTRVSFAELGSLSMEFTRLAQLTKESKYYDAVARITDALVEWQARGTKLPGVFPNNVDASGCNRSLPVVNHSVPPVKGKPPSTEAKGYVPVMPKVNREPKPAKGALGKKIDDFELQVIPGQPSKGHIQKVPPGSVEPAVAGKITKREQQSAEAADIAAASEEIQRSLTANGMGNGTQSFDDWDCVPQGLAGGFGRESFSMGGGQDSTYEYFSKQYMLLGGLEDKYRVLYLNAMEAVRKYMLFRPMVPSGRDILFSGKVSTLGYPDDEGDLRLDPEITHLTCFIGGMVGMGAKLFNLDDDIEIAKKLSDGCVWAYESTASGIMPEGGQAVPCRSASDCPWDEAMWWRWIDPMVDQREQDIMQYNNNKADFEAKREAERVAAQARLLAEGNDKAAAANLEGLHNKADDNDKTMENSFNSDVDVDSPPPISTRYEESLAANTVNGVAGSVTVANTSLQKRQVENDASKLPSQNPRNDAGEAGSPELKISSQEESDAVEQNYEQKLEKTQAEVESASPEEPSLPLSTVAPNHTPTVVPYDPGRPLTHKEYVQGRIEREGLPPGYSGIFANHYILRPEAIESVWYMYRITGDAKWQEKGWDMFEHIIAATSTEFGHSAIIDVTSKEPQQIDEMESFWLAETLKYFYLLYSTPDTISLDEWVLNTEAHPFKRPI